MRRDLSSRRERSCNAVWWYERLFGAPVSASAGRAVCTIGGRPPSRLPGEAKDTSVPW